MSPRRAVAVVDDDPAVAALLGRALQGSGWRVTIYTGRSAGIDALDAFRRDGLPDLVVLDQRLPDLPGTLLLQSLARTGPSIDQTVILMITGAPEELRFDWLHETFGVVGILAKPIKRETLVRAVAPIQQELDAFDAHRKHALAG